MSGLDKSRLRLPVIAAGAALAGSLATVLALGVAEARLSSAALPTVVEPAVAPAVQCGPMCSSHVVAASAADGSALVVPGTSAFGMALDAGAARIAPSAAADRPQIDASAVLDFGVAGGASAAVATLVTEAPDGVRFSGGYAFASLVR